MTEREEALRRLKDPRPPMYWGTFEDLADLAATLRPMSTLQVGDTASTRLATYVFTADGWVALAAA